MRGRAGDLRAIKKKEKAAGSLRRLKSYRDEQPIQSNGTDEGRSK